MAFRPRPAPPRPAPPRLALAAGALAGLLLAGCHNPGGPGGGPSGGGVTQLAFVTNNPSDYWTICRKGTEAAARELPGVTVQFIMPDQQQVATQRQDVDDLIAKGVTGIAISPVDPANETGYLNDLAAKANVITSDSDAADSKRLCYIGTDNHAAGLMAGGLIRQAIPRGGKVLLFVGGKDAQNAHDRIRGIADALKGSQVQVVDVRTDDADHGRAKSNAADALVRYPDVACLVGIYSYNGPAIASAVRDAGKAGRVKVVCFDMDPGTPEGIRDGTIYATVVQDPYTFGYRSIKLLAQLAKGDRSGIPADKQIIVPNRAVKRDTLDQYLADQRKKLGGA